MNIAPYVSKNSLEKVIQKSYKSLFEENNYKHMSVNKLFENLINEQLGWDENEVGIKHPRKNLIRLIYKNVFLKQLNEKELLNKLKEVDSKLRDKIHGDNVNFIQEIQRLISIALSENDLNEERELTITLRKVYTLVFIDYLKENKDLYEYEYREMDILAHKELVRSITEKITNPLSQEDNVFTILFAYASVKELSEYKGDLIKYNNMLSDLGSKSKESIEGLIGLATRALAFKNTKYLAETSEDKNILKTLYPNEQIEELYTLIFGSIESLKSVNTKMHENGYENYYLQKDKSYVYRKQLLDMLDALNSYGQYEFLFRNTLKINEREVPNKFIKEEFIEFNELKEKYFKDKDNLELQNEMYKKEKKIQEENFKKRIFSLNYHLDLINLLSEINSRFIGLMRNRERDMLFMIYGLLEDNSKIPFKKRDKKELKLLNELNFLNTKKNCINLLEENIYVYQGEEISYKILTEIFQMNVETNYNYSVRSSIAHMSLFNSGQKVINTRNLMNRKDGFLRDLKDTFKYDLKKEKSIETIIIEIFNKYDYLVDFDKKTGKLTTRKTGESQVKYIERGNGRIVPLVSEKEQGNAIYVFNNIDVYIHGMKKNRNRLLI